MKNPISSFDFFQIHGGKNRVLQSQNTFETNSGWFYIHFLAFMATHQIDKICSEQNICLDHRNFVHYGWHRDYLDEKQVVFIKNDQRFEIFRILPETKRRVFDRGTELLVEAHESWKYAREGVVIETFAPSMFFVRGDYRMSELLSDPKVIKISERPVFSEQNRFNAGYLQTGSQKAQLINGSLNIPRPIHDRGLNGKGQIVTVFDSGVDSLHPFFYDPNVPTPFDRANYSHRKIVRIIPKADKYDAPNGHGTHVCGTVAGSVLSHSSGSALYEGMAPGAKLVVYDIGYVGEGGSMSGRFDSHETSRELQSLGSYICSNSWGSGSSCTSLRWAYTSISYNNPNLLYVFANGNSGKAVDISCPADSKNVLSVGGVYGIGLSSIFDENVPTFIEGRNRSSVARFARYSLSPFHFHMKENGYPLVNISRYIFDSRDTYDLTKRIVIIDEPIDVCEKISISVARNASAVIIVDTHDHNCSSVPIPVYSTDADNLVSLLRSNTLSIIMYPFRMVTEIWRAWFSSMGPSTRNMIKPDIVIPGAAIISSRSGDPKDFTPRPLSWEYMAWKSGSSMSTPAASGLIAIIRQFFESGWYPNMEENSSQPIIPSSYLMKSLIITAARPAYAATTKPNYETGFGIPNLANIFPFNSGGIRIIDRAKIMTNQRHTYSVFVNKTTIPLVITLTYLDVPTSVDDPSPLHCDLDLIVISPKGNVYYGNGYPDSFNTVERVYIESKTVQYGEYEIIVVSHFYESNLNLSYALSFTGPFNQTDYELNPVPPIMKPNNMSLMKCINGEMIDGVCQCNSSFTGALCNLPFVQIEMNQELTFKMVSPEVRRYRIYLGKCDQQYPPIIMFYNLTVNAISSIAYSYYPFSSPTDTYVIHQSSRYDTMNHLIDCMSAPDPNNVTWYFALYSMSESGANFSFKIKSTIPDPTPDISSTFNPTNTIDMTPESTHICTNTLEPTNNVSSAAELMASLGNLPFTIGFIVLIVSSIFGYLRFEPSDDLTESEKSDSIERILNSGESAV